MHCKRHTRYHSNYGYVSGGGLSDIFNIIRTGIGQLPPSVTKVGNALKPALKRAATNIATQGITAAGDRIGSDLANRIAPKTAKELKVGNKVPTDEILKDLKLTVGDADQYGFGRKIRGKGIKILQ